MITIQQLTSAERVVVQLHEAITRAKVDRTLKAPVASLEAKLGKLFAKQGRALVAALAPVIRAHVISEAEIEDPGSFDTAFDSAFDEGILDTSSDMLEELTSATKSILTVAAGDIAKDLGVSISFSLANPRAVRYLEDYGADLISEIDETTRGTIKRLVLAGAENGSSYDSIAKAIKARFRDMAVGKPQQHIRSRAHLIAITELGNSYQAGNLLAVQDLQDRGLKMLKHWLTVGDDRVSDGCKDNQDQGWIALDTAFASGDQRPLRFPGCRCVLQYRRSN